MTMCYVRLALGHKMKGRVGDDQNELGLHVLTDASFGAAGGYIGGSKDLIQYLRANSHAKCYSRTISPPVANQVISSMECILNKELGGIERIQQLSRNAVTSMIHNCILNTQEFFLTTGWTWNLI